MHQVINALSRVAQRYAPSRILSFDLVHVFKTLQLMGKYGRISRTILVHELGLGEGSIKTLVKHLKMNGLVETSKGGMWMSDKGLKLYSKFSDVVTSEINIPECSFNVGKYNHVVLLKNKASEIGQGIEQRDAAIKMGANGATTLLYEDGKFYMPGKNQDFVKTDKSVQQTMIEKLHPENKDVIIIGSAENKRIAEFAAKNAALITVSEHKRHF